MSRRRRRALWWPQLVAAWGLALAMAWTVSELRAQEAPLVIDPGKLRAITQEVLSSQRDPRGKTQKLEALRAYERFVMEDLVGRSALRAEAMHNLADLYTEIETASAERVTRGRTGAPTRTPSRAKSISVYERLLDLYPGRAENDGALYQLARAYTESGRPEEAAARLRRILAEHPASAYAPEAAFRLGLRSFAARNFSEATQLFQQAAQGHDMLLVEAARFHLGWTLLNLQEYRRAVDAFASILDTAASKRKSTSSGFSLSEFPEVEATFLAEVIKATLLAFDYLGGPEEMRSYLAKREPRPYQETLYRTLGSLYQEQDRTAEAVATYEAFLAASPLHPDAPRFQSAIAEAYTRAKWQTALIQAREQLAERYGPGSTWTRANPGVAAQTALPLVKDSLHELALYEHAQAQRTRRSGAWEKALARHDRFLAWFPQDVASARIAWLRGEALFELGRYAEAADAYQRSAYDYPLHAQTRDAAYASVTARERVVPPDGAVVPSAAEALAASAVRFVEAFPEDSRNPDLLMKAAETAGRAGRSDLADTLAQRLVTSYPSNRWITPAHRLIGQAQYDRGRFLDAEASFRRALGGATKDQSSALTALAASALYQAATGYRERGQSSEAIDAFVRVATAYPATELAPAALASAAALHTEVGQPQEAVSVHKRLVDQYPNSPESTDALRRLAVGAESAGELSDAMNWYERLAARSERAERDQLSWKIAALAERASDWPRAERTLATWATRSDVAPAQAIEAGFRAANAALNQRRIDSAAALSDAALTRYRAWRTQDPSHATTQADVLAADALVALGDRRAAACAAIRLREPLERTLADKRAALDAALAAYAEAIDIRVPPSTTAATHKIGATLDEFFQALLASERPGGLTPDQLEQYNFLLEEQAAPFEERAVQAYETNVRRTHELGLYDEWIRQSYTRLGALRPSRYLRPEAPELMARSLENSP